jgi:uncharacterized protein DUF5069
MNLNETFPRSPRDKIKGLVHILRMIDKAHAVQENSLGEYIFPCPIDDIILEFLKTNPDDWVRLSNSNTEEQMGQWVEEKCGGRQSKEIEFVNKKILELQPDSENRWKHFYKLRDTIDRSRRDVTTWVDLIDLEEGRL